MHILCVIKAYLGHFVPRYKRAPRPGPITQYVKRQIDNPRTPIEAVKPVIKHLSRLFTRTHPDHLHDSIRYLLSHSNNTYSKSAGLGWSDQYSSKKEAMLDVLYNKHSRLRRLFHTIKSGKYVRTPATRVCATPKATIDQSGNVKTRVTIPSPINVFLAEAIFFTPLHAQIKNYGTEWIGYGPALAAKVVQTGALNSWKLDGRSFDATINTDLMSAAFDVLEHFFDFSQYRGETLSGRKAVPHGNLRHLFNFVKRYYINTPTLVNETYMVITHGLPSGGLLTNMLATIIQLLCIYQQFTDVKFAWAYGDDAIVCFNGEYREQLSVEYKITPLRVTHSHVELEWLKLKATPGWQTIDDDLLGTYLYNVRHVNQAGYVARSLIDMFEYHKVVLTQPQRDLLREFAASGLQEQTKYVPMQQLRIAMNSA